MIKDIPKLCSIRNITLEVLHDKGLGHNIGATVARFIARFIQKSRGMGYLAKQPSRSLTSLSLLQVKKIILH
jgi:hypothetical protein